MNGRMPFDHTGVTVGLQSMLNSPLACHAHLAATGGCVGGHAKHGSVRIGCRQQEGQEQQAHSQASFVFAERLSVKGDVSSRAHQQPLRQRAAHAGAATRT